MSKSKHNLVETICNHAIHESRNIIKQISSEKRRKLDFKQTKKISKTGLHKFYQNFLKKHKSNYIDVREKELSKTDSFQLAQNVGRISLNKHWRGLDSIETRSIRGVEGGRNEALLEGI